jgi:hypothetical protein
MFEELESVDQGVANEAVYRVGLRMYERDRFPTWRRWLADRPPAREAGSIPLAERILGTIERRTGKPLVELTDDELRPYRLCMDRIMRARHRRENRADPARVQQILDEMRAQYSHPADRVA